MNNSIRLLSYRNNFDHRLMEITDSWKTNYNEFITLKLKYTSKL